MIFAFYSIERIKFKSWLPDRAHSRFAPEARSDNSQKFSGAWPQIGPRVYPDIIPQKKADRDD